MTRAATFTKWLRTSGSLLVALGFGAVVVILIMWLAGWFSPKVPTETPDISSEPIPASKPVIVRTWLAPDTEKAIGEVQAVHETTIRSKLLATVKEVNISANQKVRVDEVLMRLDDADLKAKLQQAESAIDSIRAKVDQLTADKQRYANLVQKNAVSQQAYDKIAADLDSTKANFERAKAAYDEVRAKLDWATIRSPIDGKIIDKMVHTGDIVTPGQVLVTLYDQKRMQLVASVRESLVHQIKEGEPIGVQVDVLQGKTCQGIISEIVPEANSNSRSFQVKVTGPCPPNVYSGMSGKILILRGHKEVLIIPDRAIRRVGQLELVRVVEKDRNTKKDRIVERSIRTGQRFPATETGGQFGDDIEVLSGLQAGEEILVPTSDQNR
ncbi:MAG: efflux RND transporter periplasmic adaptor subunit [Planctomycetia bacterium]|jgi:RND family efflux transporter MFP subunit